MVKLHITMTESELADLSRLAEEIGLPKSRLIREAVGTYLVATRRRSRQAAMRRYAEGLGDRSADFTTETDAHVTERLLRETKW